MQRIPYSLNDATALCRELQHVKGRTFDPELPEMMGIECVAVAPYDQANKKRFLLLYLLCEDADKALKEAYVGLLYDVVVIARSSQLETDLMYYDIDTWLEKNKISIADIRNKPFNKEIRS